MNSLTGWGGANVEHASALNGPELTRTALNCSVATSVDSICPGRRALPGLTGSQRVRGSNPLSSTLVVLRFFGES